MYRNLAEAIGLGMFMLMGAAFGFCVSPIPMGGYYQIQGHFLQAAIVFGGAIVGGAIWKMRNLGADLRKPPEGL